MFFRIKGLLFSHYERISSTRIFFPLIVSQHILSLPDSCQTENFVSFSLPISKFLYFYLISKKKKLRGTERAHRVFMHKQVVHKHIHTYNYITMYYYTFYYRRDCYNILSLPYVDRYKEILDKKQTLILLLLFFVVVTGFYPVFQLSCYFAQVVWW